jgi:hypothetical protein
MFCAIAVEANSILLRAKSRFVFIIIRRFVFVLAAIFCKDTEKPPI